MLLKVWAIILINTYFVSIHIRHGINIWFFRGHYGLIKFSKTMQLFLRTFGMIENNWKQPAVIYYLSLIYSFLKNSTI